MSIIIKLYLTGDTMNKTYIDLHSSTAHGFESLAEKFILQLSYPQSNLISDNVSK